MTSEKKDEEPHLKIAIQPEAAEKLKYFLKEKGLPERWGVPLLIEYGLSDETEKELGGLKSEMQSQMRDLWRKYGIMKFNAYRFFTENTRISMKLNMLLSENQALKKRLKDERLVDPVPSNEWDDWDNTVTKKYYRKYVCKNSA
jgi:regulator of replication initiation timing